MKVSVERIVGYVIIACVLVAVVLLPRVNSTYVEGDRLTFSLPNLEGETVSSSDPELQGKVLLVNLWGTWCPPCRYEIPYLAKLKEDYGPQGFEVIGIEFPLYAPDSEEDRAASLKKFGEELGVNYTVLMGTEAEQNAVVRELPELRNFSSFPTSIFIGRDGVVAEVTMGFYEGDMPRYRKLIESLLRGEAPSEE